MKLKVKYLGFSLLLGATALGTSSCNDLLDLEPVNQITPESYYNTADQLASYLNNLYTGYLVNPYTNMFHTSSYNSGMGQSDGNTDIMTVGGSGSTSYFATDYWEVPTGKQLQGFYGNVRTLNYFLEKALAGKEAGTITGDAAMVDNYIGEAYFLRALTYFRMLCRFGDMPIVDKVLVDSNEEILQYSQRAPRNEVARFILADLDKAIANLADRSKFNGQRINKQVAYLFKSRVALFEATFEKYHKGSGRVPGDSNWPGASMSYNSGKSFNIEGEISFFLQEAMDAAKAVADGAVLTENTGVIEPGIGVMYGWNPYFEMYSQPSLASVDEVLMWRQYDQAQGVTHDAPYRILQGSSEGFTRTFTESFLMKNGLPIYAAGSGYQGDVSMDKVKAGRDERLQLFMWGESTLIQSDNAAPNVGAKFELAGIARQNQETRCYTGYQPRKYYTYDYAQTPNDELRGTNACPMFRTAEAMLNYMEACFEKNGSLDDKAKGYWRALRTRAGIEPDFNVTVAATDLSKEGDFGVYSGTSQVDVTLYNIRRERMHELFCEGMRFADLIRWRSFDNLMTKKWIPEGINYWEEMYTLYDEELKADGSADAVVSPKELGKYLQPYGRNQLSTNPFKDGYTWHEANYLYPIGYNDMVTASPDRKIETTLMYQNVNWPTSAGGHALK